MHDAQAAYTLASHLRAHGMTACVRGSDVILDSAGSQISVTPHPSEYADIRSAQPEAVLQAVNACLARAGHPGINSTTYRPVSTKRARLDTDFEDIVLRSKALARCPNPDPAVIKKFEHLARRTAGRIFLRFKLPLKAFGYEREDLESVAMVHLVTAIHRYRVGDEERDAVVLGRYLRQRLVEVVRKVQRKSLQCSSDTRMRNFGDVQVFIDMGAHSVAE